MYFIPIIATRKSKSFHVYSKIGGLGRSVLTGKEINNQPPKLKTILYS